MTGFLIPQNSTGHHFGLGCVRHRLQFHTTKQKLKLISLDADLRMDGIPALDLWHFIIEVFHFSSNQSNNTKNQVRGNSSRDTTCQGSNPARQF